MKPASAIGKEWYEQIAALEAYAVGKTPADVAGMKVTEVLGGRRKFRGKPGIFLPLPKQEKSPGEGLELLPGGA